MTRFNYLAERARPNVRGRGVTFAVDNRIRGPLAALLGVIVVTVVLTIVQWTRLEAAQRVYAAAALQAAASERAVDELDALRLRVTATTHLRDEIADIRRANLMRSNELTRIGNRLPPQTWLGSLRYEAGTYALEGSSDRAAAVGLALAALRDPASASSPQLISLHDDPSASGAPHVRYRLELQSPR